MSRIGCLPQSYMLEHSVIYDTTSVYLCMHVCMRIWVSHLKAGEVAQIIGHVFFGLLGGRSNESSFHMQVHLHLGQVLSSQV